MIGRVFNERRCQLLRSWSVGDKTREWVSSSGETIAEGEHRSTRGETCPSATLSTNHTHGLVWIEPGPPSWETPTFTLRNKKTQSDWKLDSRKHKVQPKVKITDVKMTQSECVIKAHHLYTLFWVIPWRLSFICPRFGTLCLFHLHRRIWRWNRQSVPKRRHLNSDAGELPRRKHKTYRTRRKFEIKEAHQVYSREKDSGRLENRWKKGI